MIYMLKYYTGTVFNAPVKTFVNTVNCVGVMGAGIALEFKLRFPEMYDDYREKCNQKEVIIGKPYIYKYSQDIWIMNFPTKNHWRHSSNIGWIEEGLKYFREKYREWGIDSIAFPKLGTANGKLDWFQVMDIMEKHLSNLDIDIYICLDEKKEADGIEKQMVDSINNSNIDNLVENIRISKRQAQTIIDHLPINRFWHISKLKGIGKITYEKLFMYYYKRATKDRKILNDESKSYEQLTFINKKT